MKTILALIAIALSLICTIPMALKMFNTGYASITTALVFHTVSALLCSFGFFLLTGQRDKWLKGNNLWWVFVLVFCLTLPLYGIISVIAIYLGQRWRKKSPPPVVSDEITVQDPAMFMKASSRSAQLEILDRLDIEPLIDIFRSGQSDLKISAVKLLGMIKSKQAITTLSQALLDEDIEVRLFAAGMLGNIEDEYARGIDKRKKPFETDPSNAKAGLNLALYYLTYAESGLLDQIAKTFYFQESIRVLDTLIQNNATLHAKARAYNALEEYDKALKCITSCVESDPSNSNYDMLLWEILFAKGEYADVAGRIREAKEKGNRGLDEGVAEYWK